MSRHHLLSGICAAVFAFGMISSGSASAWPTPAGACTADNEGEYAMTSEYSLLYVEYATYVCSSDEWGLLHVSRCYYLIGRCTLL
jgi:hypothetical protein